MSDGRDLGVGDQTGVELAGPDDGLLRGILAAGWPVVLAAAATVDRTSAMVMARRMGRLRSVPAAEGREDQLAGGAAGTSG